MQLQCSFYRTSMPDAPPPECTCAMNNHSKSATVIQSALRALPSSMRTGHSAAETMEFAAFLRARLRTMSSGMLPSTSHDANKSYKHSYLARKEEKEKLMKELKELQGKLQELQEAERQRPPSLLQLELETALLRDAVRMQQLSLVNIQSAVSSYVSVQEAVPHEVLICLGKDPMQRREALLVAKRKKIHSALAYLTERTRFLDPFRPFSETSRFLLEGGDFCALRFDRIVFEASKVSVRQLFDAISASFSNLEMRVMDVLGVITTRDEIGYGVDGIQQSRYECFLSCGIPLEMNTVTCQEFTDRSDEYGDGGPFGVFTADYVDEDELYPYRPDQCVRHDLTGVLTVRLHTRRKFNSTTGREEEESVVVMTRASLRKQRYTDTPLPPLVNHALRKHLESWGDVMTSYVLEQIYGNQ